MKKKDIKKLIDGYIDNRDDNSSDSRQPSNSERFASDGSGIGNLFDSYLQNRNNNKSSDFLKSLEETRKAYEPVIGDTPSYEEPTVSVYEAPAAEIQLDVNKTLTRSRELQKQIEDINRKLARDSNRSHRQITPEIESNITLRDKLQGELDQLYENVGMGAREIERAATKETLSTLSENAPLSGEGWADAVNSYWDATAKTTDKRTRQAVAGLIGAAYVANNAEDRIPEQLKPSLEGNNFIAEMQELFQYATPDQIETFNRVISSGEDNALAFYKAFTDELKHQAVEAREKKDTEFANEHGVSASVRSVFNQFPAALEGVGNLLVKPLERIDEIYGTDIAPEIYAVDVAYNSKNTNKSTTYAQTVAQNIADGADKESTGKVLSFLYQTGMSIGQSAARMPLGAAGLTIGALNASSSTMNSVLEQGGTLTQATWLGAISGMVEWITEKISLDNVITAAARGTLPGILSSMFKQGIVEGSEEFAAEVLNIISDEIIRADKSELRTEAAKLMSNGMSEGEAMSQLVLQRIASATAGGLLSGLFFGGGGQFVQIMNAPGEGFRNKAANVESFYQNVSKVQAETIRQYANDVAALGLSAEDTQFMVETMDELLGNQRLLASPDGQTMLEGLTAATRALSLKVSEQTSKDAAKQQKILNKQTKLYESILAAQAEAQAALQNGDLQAHQKAAEKYRAAMDNYTRTLEVDQHEANADAAKKAQQDDANSKAAREYAEDARAEIRRMQVEEAMDEIAGQAAYALETEERNARVRAEDEQRVANRAKAAQKGWQQDLQNAEVLAKAEQEAASLEGEYTIAGRVSNEVAARLLLNQLAPTADAVNMTRDEILEKIELAFRFGATNAYQFWNDMLGDPVIADNTTPTQTVAREVQKPDSSIVERMVLDEDADLAKAELTPASEIDIMEEIVNGGRENETVQTEGETDGEGTDLSDSRTERVPGGYAERENRAGDYRSRTAEGERGTQSETREDRRTQSAESEVKWSNQQDADIQGAFDQINRKYGTTYNAANVREASNRSERSIEISKQIAGVTGRSSFFIEGDVPFGGLTIDKRQYVQYTGDETIDAFNEAHENAHNMPSILATMFRSLNSNAIPKSEYDKYLDKRYARIAARNGISVEEARAAETPQHARTEFACDMFGCYAADAFADKEFWDGYGISPYTARTISTAIEYALSQDAYGDVDPDSKEYEADLAIEAGAAIAANDGYEYSWTSMNNDKDDYREDLVAAGLVGEGKPMSYAELDTLFNTIDNVMEYVQKHSDLLDHSIGVMAEDRAYSPYKTNSDPHYKVALDYSTLCRKRILLQTIVERLQVKLNRSLSAEEQVAIRQELVRLQNEGRKIEVACALCYVEAARLKSPKVINQFLDNREQNMLDYFAKKNSDFQQELKTERGRMLESLGYPADASKNTLDAAGKKQWDSFTKRFRASYEPTADEQAIIREAAEMDRSRFLTAESLTKMARENPDIYAAFVRKISSAARSKTQETRVPYYRGDIAQVSDSIIEAMNEESGFRHQSWSDFEMVHLLDNIAAVIEMSTRNAKMHTYTKVPNMVLVNGLTNMMMNMSLIPAGETGLDANGELVFDSVEGMDYETMKKLRDLYSDVAGSIAIGISDAQVLKLLASEYIDYVIPYHISGLNKNLRGKMGIKNWLDFTKTQNEKHNGIGEKGKAPTLREWFNEAEALKAKDGNAYMVEASKRYLELCRERNLVPKFSQFLQKNADGSYALREDAQNYWKMLIDRKMVDQTTGKIIEQKAVVPIFDNATLMEMMENEVAHPTHGEDEEVADIVVQKVLNGELQISKAVKKEAQELREKQLKAAVQASQINFSENAPMTKKEKLQRATELFEDGFNADSLYESNPQGYDPTLGKMLNGIRRRNGEDVGGHISEPKMEKVLGIFSNANDKRKLALTLGSPVRVWEDVTGWGGKTAAERARNIENGNFIKDTYYEYANQQAAAREVWMAQSRQPILDAIKNNGEYGQFESAITQVFGEKMASETQAANAVFDGKTMIVEVLDGVFVLDNRGRLLYTSDAESYTEYTQPTKDKLKNIPDKGIGNALKDEPVPHKYPLIVERNRNNVTVRDSVNGRIVAQVVNGKNPNMKAVKATADALRTFYENAHREMTFVMIENGYAPPPYIENYFPHLGKSYSGIEGFIQKLSENNLPTAINGMTAMFSPGQPWNPNLQARLGDKTEFDAVRGFNGYVKHAGDTIFHTPVIQRYRQLEKALRVQGEVAETLEGKTLNSSFVAWLHEQANEWANKKSNLDRDVEEFFGREGYTISGVLTSWFSKASVGGNIRSAMSNFIGGLTGLSQIDGEYAVKGTATTLAQLIQLVGDKTGKTQNYDGFVDKIPFMQRRFSEYEDIQIRFADKLKTNGDKALYFLFSAVDRISVESVARAKYAECLGRGMTDVEAVAATNDALIKNFADRGKGQAARAFNIKALKPVVQFQAEVLNQMSHGRDMSRAEAERKLYELKKQYGNDIPFDKLDKAALSGGGTRKLRKAIMYAVLLSLYGALTRELFGYDQTWNPYGIVKDAVEDYKEGGVKQAWGGFKENASGNLPFASLFGDNGRVPLFGGLKDAASAITGLATGDSTVEDALVGASAFVPGGGQIRRSVTGIRDAKRGGKYNRKGQLQYPIADEDFWKVAVFGTSAAQPDDYNWQTDTLSESETSAYHAMVDEGMDQRTVYDIMLSYGGSNKAQKALSVAQYVDNLTEDEFDLMMEVLDIDYSRSKNKYVDWAVKNGKKSLEESRKKNAKGDLKDETLAKYEDLYEEYFRLLGMMD